MKNRWKKHICISVAAALALTGLVPVSARAEETASAPTVTASSAILVDANTGYVIYEKDADAVHYPASITKILTVLLALENCDLDETVTFSAAAVYGNEGETSNIARDVGEEMTMEQTLYAVMLESANECAYAAAEHVCDGNYPLFIDMMNERAEELGCTNTHFVNANGLPDDDHYTSCRDMALIAQEAIQNSDFRRIIGTRAYTIPPTNKHSEETPLNNHHRMINAYKGGEYLYDACIGGKTGYTEEARNTLVTYAEEDGMLLLSVVMETENPYEDTISLMDYGFSHMEAYNVAQCETRYSGAAEGSDSALFGESESYACLDPEATVVLPVGASFEDTEVTVSYENTSATVLGTLDYLYQGSLVGSADVIATGETGTTYTFAQTIGTEENNVAETTSGERQGLHIGQWRPAVRRALGILLVVVGGVLLLMIFWREISMSRTARRGKSRYKTIKPNRRW